MPSPHTLAEPADTTEEWTDARADPPPTSSELAAELDATERILAELVTNEERVLRETEAGVTEKQRDRLVQIRTDQELHERRRVYLNRRLVEVLGEELQADASTMFAELAELQEETSRRAEEAVGPKRWAAIGCVLDGALTGLEDLQDAHRVRHDRQALVDTFELEDEENTAIVAVAPLELEVREHLQELERQISDVFGACDRTAGIGCGRVPHRPRAEVSELVDRHKELREAG